MMVRIRRISIIIEPIIKIISTPIAAKIDTDGVWIQWNVTDQYSGYSHSLAWFDSGLDFNSSMADPSFRIQGFMEGEHKIVITAFDNCGNNDTITFNFTVKFPEITEKESAGLNLLSILSMWIVLGIITVTRRYHIK